LSDPDGGRTAAVIFGCSGLELTPDERALFSDLNPLGFILFARNCETPAQVSALVSALRATVGRKDAPVLIDQEGGRVARLGPPHWRKPPPGQVFVNIAAESPEDAEQAAFLNFRLIGHELKKLGINVDCAPVLDLPITGAHDIIGDRALGGDTDTIILIGRAQCRGLLAEGVLPVIKHIPGHGRAQADSHVELPVVEAPREVLSKTDFIPFRELADMPMAMTAHVTYRAIDADRPATISPVMIDDVIRKEIGFSGLLISDDIGMKALSDSLGHSAGSALDAGCDVVLHCSGMFEEMEEISGVIPILTEAARGRADQALKLCQEIAPVVEAEELAILFDEILEKHNINLT
jgi:beta-N-acetylhexosaminidase